MPELVWDSEFSSWAIHYEDGYQVLLPADSEDEAKIMLEHLEEDEGVLYDE